MCNRSARPRVACPWSGLVGICGELYGEQGQLLIDQGRYKQAIGEFTCVIDAHPTEVEGYRGRIEAQLLLGQYSNAFRDYARVTAVVTPVHSDAESMIFAGYAARLDAAPNNIPALMGASFARWVHFDYLGAIHLLDHLLDLEPANPYGNLFRGSSRLLKGHAVNDGVGGSRVRDRARAREPRRPLHRGRCLYLRPGGSESCVHGSDVRA